MAIDTTDTPFNNPSAQPALVQMWRSAIAKAHTEIPPFPVQPAVIECQFDGGGQPLVAGLGGTHRITFPCRILSCYIFAGQVTTTGVIPVAATATVFLGLGEQDNWGGGASPLYGGTVPTITAASSAIVSVTDWTVDLQPGDLIPFGLLTFSGTATWLTVTLGIRRLDMTGVGVSNLTDSTITDFTNSSGAPFVVRG